MDFPSGPVVKDLLCNSKHLQIAKFFFLCQRNMIPLATEQLSLHVSNRVYTVQVLSMPSSNRESLPQGTSCMPHKDPVQTKK